MKYKSDPHFEPVWGSKPLLEVEDLSMIDPEVPLMIKPEELLLDQESSANDHPKLHQTPGC